MKKLNFRRNDNGAGSSNANNQVDVRIYFQNFKFKARWN